MKHWLGSSHDSYGMLGPGGGCPLTLIWKHSNIPAVSGWAVSSDTDESSIIPEKNGHREGDQKHKKHFIDSTLSPCERS